eukprot:15485053-Alexandrium_andersonii.AAC.1
MSPNNPLAEQFSRGPASACTRLRSQQANGDELGIGGSRGPWGFSVGAQEVPHFFVASPAPRSATEGGLRLTADC